MRVIHEELLAAVELLESNLKLYDEMRARGRNPNAARAEQVELVRSFVGKIRSAIFEANEGLREEALEAIERGQMN